MPVFTIPLYERALGRESGQREFSSTEVRLPEPLRSRVLAMAAAIPDADLADDGREERPHVTVKFGLHTNNAQEVVRVVRGVAPVSLTLGPTAVFQSNPDYDVVHVTVRSPSLTALNRRLTGTLSVTDTQATYVPHATLAYVKKGRGSRYVGRTDVAGQTATLDTLVFSGKDRAETLIPLEGRGW